MQREAEAVRGHDKVRAGEGEVESERGRSRQRGEGAREECRKINRQNKAREGERGSERESEQER